MAVEMYLDDAGIVLLAAYEDGRLAKFTSKRPARWSDVRMDEGEGWQLAWYERGHREPSVSALLLLRSRLRFDHRKAMGLAVSPNHCFAWTAAADHFVSRYDLSDDLPEVRRPTFRSIRMSSMTSSIGGSTSRAIRYDASWTGIDTSAR